MEDEDPASEVQRFAALLGVLLETVPEIGGWWADSNDESDPPMTLGDAGIEASVLHLFDADHQPLLVESVWPRMLQVVELALLVADILWSDETREVDAVTVDAFAAAGLVCDLTRTRESIRALLPWMGPETIEAAQGEVEMHSVSRGFGVEDVDWSGAGASFKGLGVQPDDLVPNPMP